MADGSTHHPEQDIQKGKYVVNGAEFSVDAGSPLPEGYGDNRLVIMSRDPFWFFAYWEITHERAEQIRVAHGRDSWDRAILVLRVHDLGDSAQTPIDASTFLTSKFRNFPANGTCKCLSLRTSMWPILDSDGPTVNSCRSSART